MSISKKSKWAVAGVALALVSGGVAYAGYTVATVPPAVTDKFYACVSSQGIVRAATVKLNKQPTSCPAASDTIRIWSAQGPTGPDGLAGPVGATGATGATGVVTGALMRTIDLSTDAVDQDVAFSSGSSSHGYPLFASSDCRDIGVGAEGATGTLTATIRSGPSSSALGTVGSVQVTNGVLVPTIYSAGSVSYGAQSSTVQPRAYGPVADVVVTGTSGAIGRLYAFCYPY